MNKGIDVSHWQNQIDWTKVAAAGIEFAMIKLGNIYVNGTIKQDAYFTANINGALAAGLRVGVYAYCYAVTPANTRIGAANACTILAPYKDKITLPVALDMEEAKIAATGKDNCTAMAVQWRDEVVANGMIPALYSNPNWLKNYVTVPGNMKLWLAHYAKSPYCAAYMWQYSATGTVSGISGAVDLDYGYFEDSTAEKAPEKLSSAKTETSYSPNEDIDYLAKAGIIQSPEVWYKIISGETPLSLENHLLPILSKFADAVKDKDDILDELQGIVAKFSDD